MSLADRIKEKMNEEHEKLELSNDPRPDLARDSDLWIEFLKIAKSKSEKLAGILHGFRCAGTMLVPHKKFGYAMRPYIDKSGKAGWTCTEEYNAAKNEWLADSSPEILKLLTALKEAAGDE